MLTLLRSLLTGLGLLIVTAAPAFAAEQGASYAGLWDTTFGLMRINEANGRVSGVYQLSGGSTVEGRIENGRMLFAYREPDAGGDGYFDISQNGSELIGGWRAEGSADWSEWTGTRVAPEDGVRWLVVIEAPWETTLAESEYAFADMLEAYFTMGMASHVRVRKRDFHDSNDLLRWCAEVAYIAEPVVLLLSTHGGPDGLSVNGETIGADVLTACVQSAPNVELLHLSGCSMMAGDIPATINQSLAPGMQIPITGYQTDVAWDASAVADFTFLSMLLIRGLEPRQSVEEAIRVAPFLGERPIHGSPWEPLGLRLEE